MMPRNAERSGCCEGSPPSRGNALRAWRGVVLALASLCVATSAHAQSSLELQWSAPPSCPDRAWVVRAVDRLVSSPSAPLQVSAVVRQEEDGWIVDLEMHGAASGTRTLRATSCPSIARATALLVALALDPQAASRAEDALANDEPPREEPPAAPPSPSSPPPDDSTTSATPDVAAASAPTPVRPFAFAGATIERALVPGLAVGVGLGGGITWRALRIDAGAQLLPHTSASLDRVPGVGADFSLAALSARSCIGHALPAFAAFGCAAVRGARISGQGTGTAERYRQTALLVALEPGVIVRAPGRRSGPAIELETALVVPVTRPDFVFLKDGPSEPLFRVSAVGLRVALFASYQF